MLRQTTLIALLAISGAGCDGRNDPPAWAENNYPDYQLVKSAYRELAYEVRTAAKSSQQSISSFPELAREITNLFPHTLVVGEGSNPFPKMLPSREYYWLSSWSSVTNMEPLPFLWTTVQSREPIVLSVTTRGEIVAQKTNDFERVVKGLLAQGAKILPQRP
jgi:hypothetical protein